MLKLDNAANATASTRRCKFALHLDDEEQGQVRQLKTDGFSYRKLEGVVKANGIDLSAATIRDHLAGECACIGVAS